MSNHEVALSFAGEDRAYVEMVARFLQNHKVSFFYDDYNAVDLWGKDLYTHLSMVYSEAQRYVVMFISHHYADKVWTNHERRSAQSRALIEKGEYILPVRFDDTIVEGLLPTVSYLDARRISPEILASKILEKLGRPIILSKANAVPAPHSPALCGHVVFDHCSHDGRFELGHGDLTFESRWGGAANQSIYCYNDAPSIRGVAEVPKEFEFKALSDVSTLDFTSRTRRPAVGQFVVLQNSKGFFALLRIESIEVMSRGDPSNELRFRYWIRPSGDSDFSNENG
ncbi:MAG: TIR domain-containing protein [Prosthecobacter sp.]|uniref:TIR domain-containing protein n=1 Tax=Prosthecobacter sp. TaxID=1965333 RepID=UPI003BB1C69D